MLRFALVGGLVLGVVSDASARESLRRATPLSRQALQQRLRKQVARPMAKLGTFAVYIKRAGGPVLFARRGTTRLHPASCVKLITAAAVLRRLGKDFRFDTVVRGSISGGRMTSPLSLRGHGDPSLTRDDLARFAAQIKARGVREIPGGVVVDDTYFDGRRFPPGFKGPSSSSYMTPTGAVSVDGNTVEVTVTPVTVGARARVALTQVSAYVHAKNGVMTAADTRLSASASRVGKTLQVFVRGTIRAGSEPVRQWVRVLDPSRYAGELFKRALEAQGIRVGLVRRARAPKAPLLIRHRSKALWELVQVMNRTSNNFYAEQLLKALGATVHGAPGTTRKGVRAVRGIMHRAGVNRSSYQLANGSGLFGSTRIAAKHLVRLLERLRTLPWLYSAIRESLPVAGRSGTLAKRFVGTVAAGRVRAKTGTFKQVSCLAGYVDGRSGTAPIVFAIIHNGFNTSHRRIRRVQDKIVELVARYALGRN
ncbi:MAG: D-alanyl-D-alanine carboxypeptidase/D-alanyl-D-alanine-endopeptidase [bacterium]